MAAAANSLAVLLANLTASLQSATEAVPKNDVLAPQADGLSLLTTKNELLLSYVQNLVFLILVKLRHGALLDDQADQAEKHEELSQLNAQVVEKLVELRLYIEKGIKPLESRLKYQVDKVIRAAEDATRAQGSENVVKRKMSKANGIADRHTNVDVSDSDESDFGSGDESEESEDFNELSYRPNPAALLKPADAQADDEERKDGIYRPPKITPTSLPITMAKEGRSQRRQIKSATLDEFVANEISTAPIAEPSIGTTIRSGGRHTLSQRERDEAATKRKYEEENFIRLPKETKKEKAKKKRPNQQSFGGEEWQNLGAGLDRIDRLTKKSSNAASMLARSRKRDVQDSPRDSGQQPGSQFAKRQKLVSRR